VVNRVKERWIYKGRRKVLLVEAQECQCRYRVMIKVVYYPEVKSLIGFWNCIVCHTTGSDTIKEDE
jgi:hypothetical protein